MWVTPPSEGWQGRQPPEPVWARDSSGAPRARRVSGRKLSGERRADLGVDALLEAGSPLDDPCVVERKDLREDGAGDSRSPVDPVVAVEQACPVAGSSTAHPWDVLEDEMEAQPEALGDRQGGHVVAKLGDRRVHDLRQNHTGELVAERKLDGLGPQYSLAVELTAAQQRAHEAQIVWACRVGAPAARPELGLGKVERVLDEAAVGHPEVQR